jgi:hypothetical protein
MGHGGLYHHIEWFSYLVDFLTVRTDDNLDECIAGMRRISGALKQIPHVHHDLQFMEEVDLDLKVLRSSPVLTQFADNFDSSALLYLHDSHFDLEGKLLSSSKSNGLIP